MNFECLETILKMLSKAELAMIKKNIKIILIIRWVFILKVLNSAIIETYLKAIFLWSQLFLREKRTNRGGVGIQSST